MGNHGRPWSLLITCEHGGNRVPPAWRHLFGPEAEELLASHRGWDAGAADLARQMARRFAAPLHVQTITRLLADANRSLHHRSVLHPAVRRSSLREQAIAACWTPHREAVEAAVANMIERGERVLHVAVHSFTPVLDGVVRKSDIGILYDPRRSVERLLAQRWQDALEGPGLRVRRNSPYRVTADGLPTALRKRYSGQEYAGFELEVNQALVAGARWPSVRKAIAKSVESLTTEY